MPFNIIRNDITKLEVDAIVNAANSNLQAGGGVCGAIFSAAGREKLQTACNKIGHCGIGEAVITKGFNLLAKYIIHTVGPIYGENPPNEEEQLYSCYKNSLMLAKRKRLSSIAFPVISSGIYGYPKAKAIKIASRAIKDFLQENEMTIYLVVYDNDTFKISEKLFSAVESYIDEKMVRIDTRVRSGQSVNITDGFNTAEHNTRPIEATANMFNDDLLPTSSYHPLQSAPKTSKRPKPPKKTRTMSPKSPLFPQSISVPNGAPCKNKNVKKRSLSELLNQKGESFSEMLLRLIDEKGMTDVEVYKRANIDRKLFSKIRKRDYTPKKTTVIALAIGLKLNLDETKDLLKRAGFALSDWNRFDIIIEYFIDNKNYDIFEINETLFAFDQQLLGA